MSSINTGPPHSQLPGGSLTHTLSLSPALRRSSRGTAGEEGDGAVHGGEVEAVEEGEQELQREQKNHGSRGSWTLPEGIGDHEADEEDGRTGLLLQPVRQPGQGAESQVLHHAPLCHHAHLLARLPLTR